MNKDKFLTLLSKMSFTCIGVFWLLTVAGTLVLLGAILSSIIALNSPPLETGKKNSILLLDAIEAYKADHGFYPPDLYDTIEYDPSMLEHLSDYEYETYSANYSAREFMLSFRIRWTIDSWYCYYSGDRKWLQSDPTCWSNPRPIKKVNK